MKAFFKKIALKAFAVIILLSLYSMTRLPSLSEEENIKLSKEFGFEKSYLYEPINLKHKTIRNVHSQYENISAWISSVGASVAITDLDNNGFSNDIIHVDPRFDKVLISTAKGTPSTYTPYLLSPQKLAFDSATTAPMGVLANDFDKNGQMDLLVYYWGRTPIVFFQNEGNFQEKELNTTIERWFTNAATIADFDGDGHLDILISNYFPDGSRVLETQAEDNNQVMQHSMSRAFNGGKDHFFLWNEDEKTFVEHQEWEKGIENPEDWTLAVAACDLNEDLLPELYFANDFGPDKLLLNLSKPGQLSFKQLKGERSFTDIRSSVLGKDSFKGMGVDFGDINNDGKLDIFVSNIADEFALEESHFAFINNTKDEKIQDTNSPFINKSEELGLSRSSWSWDAKFGDFNNDGVLELIQATGFVKGKKNKWAELQELAIGNDELLAQPSVWPSFKEGTDLSGYRHNPFFVKTQGRFFDIAALLKIDQLQVSRGIALSDVDNDGDTDFVVANQWESSVYYENKYAGKNNYLGLKIKHDLEFSETVTIDSKKQIKSSPAIGAMVKVYKNDGKVLLDVIDGGNGHSGKNSTDLLFGLGDSQIAKVEINWKKSDGTNHKKVMTLKKGWHEIYLPI